MWPSIASSTRFPNPQLGLTGREEDNGTTRCRLSVLNWAEFSNEFFAISPDLPPCGLNTSASRTWVDVQDADTGTRLYGFCALGSAKQLAELWFTVPAGAPAPANVRVKLTDRSAQIERVSNAVSTTAPHVDAPPYRPIRQQLNQTVEPETFAFSPALHGYMFQGVTPTSGNNELIRYRFQWLVKFHTYLQDASRPSVVYVFADQFKIARRRDAPFTPFALCGSRRAPMIRLQTSSSTMSSRRISMHDDSKPHGRSCWPTRGSARR